MLETFKCKLHLYVCFSDRHVGILEVHNKSIPSSKAQNNNIDIFVLDSAAKWNK